VAQRARRDQRPQDQLHAARQRLQRAEAVEQSRRLVEDVGVLAESGTIGTVPNIAIQKYLNSKQVPQLLITAADGAS